MLIRNIVDMLRFVEVLDNVGLILVAVDFILNRFKYVVKNFIWLYLLLVVAVISAVVRYQYGFVISIKIIMWSLIQFHLIATSWGRLTKTDRKKLFLILHSYASLVLIPAFCYMFYQYFTEQAYNIDGVVQGYSEGRLFGLFNSVAKGALISSLLAIMTFVRFRQTHNLVLRIIYIIELIVCIVYLPLADTRGVYLGIALIYVLSVFYVLRKKYLSDRIHLKKCVVLGIVISILGTAILYGFKVGVRRTGIYLIYMVNYSEDDTQIDELIKEKERPKQQTISSRRVVIWKNYLDIFNDDISHIVIGLSPGGINKYLYDRYPDNYLVAFVKEVYPHWYKNGMAYGTHNDYLHVLMTTGIPGFVIMMIFFIKSLVDVSGYFLSGKENKEDIAAIMMIIVFLVLNLFEDFNFFEVQALPSFFWIISGYMLTRIQEGKGCFINHE